MRLYHQVRTAHLERAAQLPKATIVYGDKRYDFEDALAGELDLVHAKGWRAAWYLLRHDVGVLEVNEPLFIHAARATAVALLGLELGRLRPGPRPRVVSYAIENFDPRALPTPRSAKAKLSRRLDRALMPLIWRRLDRIAFGTTDSAGLYDRHFPPPGGPERLLVPALPKRAVVQEPEKDPLTVVFLGALSDRKGLPQVLQAWSIVREHLPQARLTLIGKGPLESVAALRHLSDQTVDLIVDPPREQIYQELRRTQVLVLAPQPSPVWREQVGLPLTEGLSFGCTAVTTAETGLADWLLHHGHRVIENPTSVDELAAALISALEHPIPPAKVLASLPEEDGRLAADRWLFKDCP